MKAENVPDYVESPFKGSKGWACKFLNRHNFVNRAFTSVGQKVPENALALMEATFGRFDDVANGIDIRDIANMDETPVYFDMPRSRTFDTRGVKTVKCKTTGHEKMRFTVVLTITADGRKLPPMIIWKGLKKVPKATYPKDMVIVCAAGRSMTGDLMERYRERVWAKCGRGIFKPKSFLLMDTHRAHQVESVKQSLRKENKTDILFIPGGMTPILQPLDVYINKSFKSKVKNKWHEWMRSGEVTFTKTGKRQRASYQVVCEWVQEAWDDIDCDMIKESFIGCGMSHERAMDKLHSGLRKLIDDKRVELEEEHSGLTDDEEDICVSEDEGENCDD